MDLPAVADDLYGLAPGDFTAAREARAAEVKKGGDAQLAAAIKKLRRPTVGAWLVNLLVRERGDEVSQLLELGAALRAAQSQLAADDLRRLSQQRHQAVTALSREARQMAQGIGQNVSESTERDVESTLEAALADTDAGDAVRSGRLTTALSYSGMGPVDVTGSVAAPIPPPAASPPPGDRSDASRREEVEAAERAWRQAEAAANEAQQEGQRRAAAVQELLSRRDEIGQEIRHLEHQLEDLRQAQAGAGQDLVDAEQARDQGAAEAAAAAAQRRAELDRLVG